MLYSHGRDFGAAWLFGLPSSSTAAETAHTADTAPQIFSELLAAGGALAGLTVLGLWIIGRRKFARGGHFMPANAESRGALRFVAIWVAVSAVVFAAAVWRGGSASLYLDMWRLFFSAACVCTAATAIDEVIRRKIGLLDFVCLTFATLGCGYGFLLTEQLLPHASMRGVFIAAGRLAFVGSAVQQFCRRGELREWLLISGLLAAFVLGDAAMGISTLEAADPDYQSLNAFARSLLPDHVDAEACLLISDARPPARLQYALKSVWPRGEKFRGERLG